jgi:hypothetical protein
VDVVIADMAMPAADIPARRFIDKIGRTLRRSRPSGISLLEPGPAGGRFETERRVHSCNRQEHERREPLRNEAEQH